MESMSHPKPRPGETRENFIERGMADPEMRQELAGLHDRFAALAERWRNLSSKAVLRLEVAKADTEKMIVYGWFSVIEKRGVLVRDHEGDIITEDDLLEMAHDFIRRSRRAMVMHKNPIDAEVVESVLLTRDVQEALGVSLDRAGWFGAVRYNDRSEWERDKAEGFVGFSWGGRAARERVA